MDSLELSLVVFILNCNLWQNTGHDIVITTISEPRYVRFKRGVFTGFIPELLEELSEVANFNYTLKLVNHGKRFAGKKNRQKLKHDAIDELLGFDADMIATTLSMSKRRKELVDFSIPFEKHGITALFKRPPVGVSKPFEHFEDLLYQSEYIFGTIQGSSIDRFFGTTMESPYWEMGGFMDMYDEYMVETPKQGLANVRNTNIKYMFLIDSTVADHLIHKYPCDLVTYGGQIRSKGYGFAFRKGDTLLKYKIDDALRLLIKNGTVSRLKKKWWSDDRRCDYESRYYYY